MLRPLETPIQPLNTQFLVYVKDLYQCTLSRLKAADIDQEVKERAISCMGRLLCNTGDALGSELLVSFRAMFVLFRGVETASLTIVEELSKMVESVQ